MGSPKDKIEFKQLYMLKFEDAINYKVGDKVLVSGSLELFDIV